MKNKFILLTALGAAMFSVVSCGKDKNDSKPHGKEMSAEEIAAFVAGFKEAYGEGVVPDKLLASTKKATVQVSGSNSQTMGKTTMSSTVTNSMEFDIDSSYSHYSFKAKESFGGETQDTVSESFIVKDEEKLKEYSEEDGTKTVDECSDGIHECIIYSLDNISLNLVSDGLSQITEFTKFDETNKLKMFKEEKTYFASFVKARTSEKENTSEEYKIRYNSDYLPVYMKVVETGTTGTGDTQTAINLDVTYSLEVKDSIEQKSFDKTQYKAREYA